MTLIVANTVICVPNMLVGSQVAAGTGMSGALTSFFIGGALLAIMASVTAAVGARANLSTSMIMQFPFGQRGARVVNIVLLGSILFVYAVIAAVFGRAFHAAIHSMTGIRVNIGVCTAVGSALMILVIIFGFRSLKTLAAIVVPLLVALVATMLGRAFQVHGMSLPSHGLHPMSERSAISAVIGSYIIGVVVLPDMMRYVKSAGGGMFSAAFSMSIALPLFLSAAGIVSVDAAHRGLVALIMVLGLGIPALMVLTFASWTNNANNLYSSSLVFAALTPRVPKWKLTVAAGVIGTIMALMPVLDYYINFLLAISIVLPPLAGIYASDFLLHRRRGYALEDLGAAHRIDYTALLIWASSIALGFASSRGAIRLTSVPGADAMLAAFVLHGLASRLLTRRSGGAVTL